MNSETPFRVGEALGNDVGRALARMDPADMKTLGVEIGDIVQVTGKRSTVCKVMAAYREVRAPSRIQLDGISRANADVALDEMVSVKKIQAQSAREVKIYPESVTPTDQDLDYIGSLVDGIPVVKGDMLRAMLFGSRSIDFTVHETAPKGPVVICPQTILIVVRKPEAKKPPRAIFSYEDIGGLKREIQQIREMIELPLRYPEVFEKLGIQPPKGVLLQGPPGTGKTLIARVVAHETDAKFFSINGPEIIHKFYGESEAALRKIFEEADRQAPSIIFIDEIDAIAPKRESAVGEVERRVVAQLLALMDGLKERRRVVVIAATNLPNLLDPALRRPGRFDREISISVPDRLGRLSILEIHSRGMPLAQDVDLGHLAEITHGFVGADLESLCREAAMICLRRVLPSIDLAHASLDALKSLEIHKEDFSKAMREVEPSSMREVFAEVPKTTWGDVGGLDEVKQTLQEAVEWPLKYGALFEEAGVRMPKGILLYGPPGCGKTLLAKAIATMTQVNFISVKGPQLMSKFVGESEKAVREIFQKARLAAPCIIFFDEIDALLPKRASEGESRVPERVVGQFLSELDGMERLDDVLMLAATNRLDMIDPAVLRPGRIDIVIKIPLPDETGRRAILSVYAKGRPFEEGVDLDAIASRSHGMSGADMEAICQRAGIMAIRDAIGGSNKLLIRQQHLDASLEGMLKGGHG